MRISVSNWSTTEQDVDRSVAAILRVAARERSAATRGGVGDPATAPPRLNAEILRLAVPALGALLAEPTFLLVDAAIVGHLGTEQLAGVGIASVVLGTLVGLVGLPGLRHHGAGRPLAGRRAGRPRALSFGIAGLYLAVIIGAGGAAGRLAAGTATDRLVRRRPAVTDYAVTFLRWSLIGLPAMLAVLATTGVLRGLQDTRTPLLVAVVGAVVNVGLNLWLVIGLQLGVAGSAIGTVITQALMAAVLIAVVVRAARRTGAPLTPHAGLIRGAGRAGIPLFIRTLTLRFAIIVTTVVAARQGVVALAAQQVVLAIWNFLALGLDALAIAAQALTGKALGEGDRSAARALTAAMLRWGVWAGVVIGGGRAAGARRRRVRLLAGSGGPRGGRGGADRGGAVPTVVGLGVRARRGADRCR